MTCSIKLKQIIIKFIWNHKWPRSANNLEEKGQSRKHNLPRLHTILQVYSNQNSMVLAQKQIHVSMEQNTGPRNKPIHLQSINLWKKREEYKIGKLSSANDDGKVGKLHVNQWSYSTLCHHTQKNSKWFKHLNIRRDSIKLLEENIGETLSDINHTNASLGQSPMAIEIKAKRNKFSQSVQSLSRVRLFVTPWIRAHQASLSISNSGSSLRLTSIESVIPSSHLILYHPLHLLPPVPPSIRVFSNESTLRMW